MTILFFSRRFLPDIGGVEKHVLEVGKRLINKNHRVIIFTEKQDKDLKNREIITKMEIYRIPVGKPEFVKKFIVWWWLWRHRDLIKKADIVHTHDVFFWYLPFRFLYPEKPVFVTFHGHETKFPPAKRAIFIRKISEKLAWGNICVGEYIKKWYGTKPDFVTYGGVDINKSQNLNLTLRQAQDDAEQGRSIKAQINNAKIKILFIGRLEKDTGLPIYLKALEILKKKNIDFEFDVCGDGSLRKIAEKWGRVWGFVEDINPYLTRSDLVFTSSYLSILETMKAERLIFSVYDNKLKADYLKMTPFAGFIIIKSSSKKLAEAIEDDLHYPERYREKVNNGYRWIKEQRWNKVANLYESLYSRYSFK